MFRNDWILRWYKVCVKIRLVTLENQWLITEFKRKKNFQPPGRGNWATQDHHFNILSRDHQYKYSYQIWWQSDEKCDLYCVNKIFALIWPSGLVFDPGWPSFERDRDTIKTNILTKFDDNRLKTVACIVLTNKSWRQRRTTDTGQAGPLLITIAHSEPLALVS